MKKRLRLMITVDVPEDYVTRVIRESDPYKLNSAIGLVAKDLARRAPRGTVRLVDVEMIKDYDDK